VAKVV